uniref:Transposon protein, putative, Mutator sub-class n=1 Tax=Tanacetum cinerariifolium TaxID=118510 RepID=A0A6L2NB19_TANCI|nr:transposon protein, putative, Mutator sub-class [Tanacetum cinerariifolium]
MFDNVYKRVNTFVAMDSEVMKGSKKTQAGVTKGSSKRARDEIEQESTKRQRLEKEDDTAELKRCLEIVPKDDDDVTIEATPLSSKFPTIVDYKIYKEGKKSYFKIIRADGNLQNYLTFGTMFKNFNREDLEVLKSIVKEIFKKTKPVNDMDNLLFQTLKTMFEHQVKDNIWKYQQWVVKVYNLKLYDSYGVYYVTIQNMVYYLLRWLMIFLDKSGGRLMKDIYLHEVFGYIPLMKTKILIKKLEDSEGGHQVYRRIVRIKGLYRVTTAQNPGMPYCISFHWIDLELPNEWYKSQLLELYLTLNQAERVSFLKKHKQNNKNHSGKTIVSKLQREPEAEAILANQLLCNLTCYSEQMRIREIQMTMLQICKTRTFALRDKPNSFFALEGKPPRRGLNPRPLACSNNLSKSAVHLRQLFISTPVHFFFSHLLHKLIISTGYELRLNCYRNNKAMAETVASSASVTSPFGIYISGLVLDKPLSFFYVIPGVPISIGLRPICNDEKLNDFVQILYKNDCHLYMYTEHQGYDVLEMTNDDRHYNDKSDSDIEDVEKDDMWLNKLVGKGRFIGEIEDPIPALMGRFFVEQNDLDENFVEPKYKLWYTQDDTYKLLVKCGRDVSAGKCAGKRGKKQVQIDDSLDKDKGKVGEGSSDKDLGKGSVGGSSDKGKRKLASWLEGCRKVIGLDGYFLTHTCKGRLRTAMGRDANNQMFHIAWVVVGVENKNNWTWFLSLLSDDLNLNDGAGLTVISYGHKSIDSVLDTSMQTSRKNRVVCNSKDYFREHQLAVRMSSFFKLWKKSKHQMKLLTLGWLIETQTPGVEHTLNWVVFASGFQEVEVRRQDEVFSVNIHLKKCACKMRELTRLPCVHVVAGPIPGTEVVEEINLPKPLSPGERKLPGRPRKRRMRHPLEYDHEISRVGRVMHCHREDPVMPPSSSGNKRKEPHVKKKSSQVNESSGSKNNLTPEHAIIMDKEAFVEMVRTDAENKTKDEEMWRQAYDEEKYWEEYASKFKDWEFREEQENRIGIILSVDDEHIIRNKEPVNLAEQTHVIAFASSAPIDQFPETSQDLSIEKAGSSAPVDQFPETPQDPKRRLTKEKRKQIQNNHYLLRSNTKIERDQKGLQISKLKNLNLMQMAHDLLLRKLLMLVIDCFRMNV